MKGITKEQEAFLNGCTSGFWEVNRASGLVDIDGSFDCSRMGLSDFMGIEFGNINGIFRCPFNRLVSLKGAPKKVYGYLNCSHNKLISLEGAPQEVDYFDCSHNKLISLEGAPQKVGWGLICDAITLRGCPIDLLDKIYFYNNKKYFRLKDYIITKIAKELDPEIYFKKMI